MEAAGKAGETRAGGAKGPGLGARRGDGACPRQGLTLVNFSAQPEPYLTRNTPFKPPTPPDTSLTPAK